MSLVFKILLLFVLNWHKNFVQFNQKLCNFFKTLFLVKVRMRKHEILRHLVMKQKNKNSMESIEKTIVEL